MFPALFCYVAIAFSQPVQGLRAMSADQVASSISDTIKQIDGLYASHFIRGGQEAAAAFGESIAKDVSSWESTLVNPEVSRVVAEGNALAVLKVVDDSDICTRNWGAPCPSGWLKVGNAHCAAPVSYAGGCPRMQSFNGRSIALRLKFANDCDAQWPCARDCASGLDFDTCPVGWVDDGNGYCSSPGNGACLASYKFSAMSILQREELALVCGFEWPCRGTCTENFDAQCPEGWANVGDDCLGPRNYAGDCDFSITTKGMSMLQKHALAETCGVRFPCS